MIKEVCVENFTKVPKAITCGADRLELNNDLAAGGTTPSFGVIKQTISYAHAHAVPVVVMIRPRGGNFVYDQAELEIMQSDIKVCGELGVDAVTFGCLTEDHHLDQTAMLQLLKTAQAENLEVVMHMAFDVIPASEQAQAIDWLADHGVKRILTHGGALTEPIADCVGHLQEIVKLAVGRIEILPGGGITNENVADITKAVGVEQAHGTRIVGML